MINNLLLLMLQHFLYLIMNLFIYMYNMLNHLLFILYISILILIIFDEELQHYIIHQIS